MTAYLSNLHAAFDSLLPILLVLAALTLLAFILDGKRGRW